MDFTLNLFFKPSNEHAQKVHEVILVYEPHERKFIWMLEKQIYKFIFKSWFLFISKTIADSPRYSCNIVENLRNMCIEMTNVPSKMFSTHCVLLQKQNPTFKLETKND